MNKRILTICLPFMFVFATTLMLSACDKQGPAEQAGETIDNAVEDAQEKIDAAVDEPNDGTAEKMGEEIDKAVEKTKEKVKEIKEDMASSSE